MLKIIRQREHVERLSYGLHFDAIDPATGKPFERGNGVGFDCDEHGAIIETDPQCLAHVRDVRAKVGTEFSEPYINTFRSHWVEPAVGRCSCGREVVLSDPLDNECECGACYNMSGQAVIPSRCCDDRGEPIDC